MKRTFLWASLAAGALGAGVWAARRRLTRVPAPLAEPAAIPLLLPGRVALERVFGPASADPLPLILVLHGVAADEQQLLPHVRLDTPARVVFLRAPLALRKGFQWFPARFRDGADMIGPQLARASADILAIFDTIAAQRPVARRIVLGYSQGAHLAWWLATSGRVDHVIAASGALPMTPPRPRAALTIHALHGTQDRVVPFASGRKTATAFEAAGYRVRFTPVRFAAHNLRTLGHAIAPALRAALTPERPLRLGFHP